MREIIDAALRRQRLATVVALIVGLSAGVAAEGIRFVGGPLVLLTLLPLIITMGAAVRQLRQRPSGRDLRVDGRERAFFAPPRDSIGFLPVIVGFGAYQTVTTWARADGDPWLVALTAFFALFSVGFAVLCWHRVPSVELTPEGITHRRHEKQWFVPWAALDPEGRVGAPWGTWMISLPVSRPELVRGSGVGRGRSTVVVRDVDAAPGLLAAAIRHYLTHPQDRSAIGVPQEYARLRRSLGGGAA